MIWLELCSLARAGTSHASTWGCLSILWRPCIVAWRLGSSLEGKSIVNKSLIAKPGSPRLPRSHINNSKLAPQSSMAHHSSPNSPGGPILNVNVLDTSARALTRTLRWNAKMRQQKQPRILACHREFHRPCQVIHLRLNQRARRKSPNKNESVNRRDQGNTSALTVDVRVQSLVS